MQEYLVYFLIGIICVVIGILNMRGNISLIHSYHRNRVSEEDKIPFGKLTGIGTIICGVAIMLYGGFLALSIYMQNQIFATIGNVTVAVGLVIGLGISFYAMVKYNKGIF